MWYAHTTFSIAYTHTYMYYSRAAVCACVCVYLLVCLLKNATYPNEWIATALCMDDVAKYCNSSNSSTAAQQQHSSSNSSSRLEKTAYITVWCYHFFLFFLLKCVYAWFSFVLRVAIAFHLTFLLFYPSFPARSIIFSFLPTFFFHSLPSTLLSLTETHCFCSCSSSAPLLLQQLTSSTTTTATTTTN